MRIQGDLVLHVNRTMIQISNKTGRSDIPCVIVRKGRQRHYCRGLRFISVEEGGLFGPGLVPALDCGSKVYVSLRGTVDLIDPMTFGEVRSLIGSDPCPSPACVPVPSQPVHDAADL